MLLYDAAASAAEISTAVNGFQNENKTVFAASKPTGRIKAKEVYRLEKGRLMLVENNA